MKKAFTLIELLVVIGIIGILTAALLGAFGGASDSARAAKCMANMHNLAVAAKAVGIPAAGSYEYTPKGQRYLDEKVGWISWLSNKGDPYGKRTGDRPKEHQNVDVCPFYGTGNREDELYALTNGAIWTATNKSRDIYVCPAHQRYRFDHKLQKPVWSYVMNMRMGYDDTMGKDEAFWTVEYRDDPKDGWGWQRKAKSGKYKICRDRVLLFAELPMDPGGDIWQNDCTLQYNATVDGVKLGDWGGKGEMIGFNHKIGKKPPYGHVAFADGHVEKITYNETKSNGLKPEQLTALLCEGYDLSFDGTSWKKIPGQD